MTANALANAGIVSLDQLRGMQKIDLSLLPCIGKLGMAQISFILGEATPKRAIENYADEDLVMELLRRGYVISFNGKPNGTA
jgi:hypothetical protein